MNENSKRNVSSVLPPLPVIIAVSAALALSAWYMRINYNEGAVYQNFIQHFFSEIKNVPSMLSPAGVVSICVYATMALLYLVSQYVTGDALLKRIGAAGDDRLLEIMAAAGIGTGLFSLTVFFAGFSGVLYRPLLILLILIPVVLSAITANGRGTMARLFSMAAPGRQFLFERALLLSVLILLLFGFTGSMSPPEDADALTYHLAVPQLYLNAHRIFYIPHILQSNWPFATEMHYLSAMGAAGLKAARAVNFIFVMLGAMAAAALARTINGKQGGLIAVAVFLSIPIVQGHLFLSNVEPALCFYILIATAFIVRYSRNGGRADIIAAALFSGFAAATKYTGAAYTAILWMPVVFVSIRKKQPLYGLLLFPALAAIPILPWLIRNIIWTGNPVWPLFYSILGGRNWSDIHARDYTFYFSNFFGDTGFIPALKAVAATAGESWNRNSGVVLLLLCPFLFIDRKNITRGIIPLYAGAAMALLWGMTSPQPRFLMPAAGITCALAAAAFPGRSRIVKSLLISAILFHIIIFGAAVIRHIPYAAGAYSGDDRIYDSMDEVYFYVDENSGADAKLLLLWDSRGLYSPREYVVGDAVSQAFIDYTKYSNTGLLMKRLYEERITHVVVCARTVADAVKLDGMIRKKMELTPRDPTAIYFLAQHQKNSIEAGWWKKIFQSADGSYYLYEIDYSSFVGKQNRNLLKRK